MMTGKFSKTCMAGLAIVLATASCSHDHDTYQPTKEEKMANAEAQLGVKIDPNHDWRMTAKATAKVTVNMAYGETYTVQVYSNDPLLDGVGYVLTKTEVDDGQTVEKDFEYPSALRNLVVSITSSKGFTSYKSATVVDGQLNISFGSRAANARGVTRSEESPEVPHITIPDDDYAKSFLEGAKEPTSENIEDNYDNSHYEGGQTVWVVDVPGHNETVTETKWVDGVAWGWVWQGTGGTLFYNYAQASAQGVSQEDIEWWDTYCTPFNNGNWSFYGADNKEDATFKLMELLEQTGRKSSWCNIWSEGKKGGYQEVTKEVWVNEQGHNENTEGTYVADENYVKKFKITDTWTETIPVLATEKDYGDARTVYVSGKWTLPDGKEQRVGGGAVIVVDNAGEIEIPEGALLNFVNQARLVVMPGGKITGEGKMQVTNGNAEGLEGYNGGEIDIDTFNNNFGKFYNYGTFKCVNLEGGAGLSNIYNHGVAHIVRSGVAASWGGNYSTPNTRIYNACQWICDEDMRAYVVEMVQGSYFFVGGELMMSDGNDGEADNSYVALESGALMQVHSLWNNNCSWIGPTEGYAVAELGQVTYLNWTGEPISQGYFINNIAISVEDKTVGAGNAQGIDTYVALRDFVTNGHGATGNFFDPIGKETVGNGGAVMIVQGGADISIPASDDFEEGETGCTPGYNGSAEMIIMQKPAVWSYAFEDTPLGDYDMNDVVIKVSLNPENDEKLDITLCCTGASFDLKVWLGQIPVFYGREVHDVLGQPSGQLVNTGKGPWTEPVTVTIDKPYDFLFADADFWIESPAVPDGVHIAKDGEDPHGVVIPEDWAWPVEYVHITEAYPDFVEFAKDASTTDETVKQWYKNPVADLVVKTIP